VRRSNRKGFALVIAIVIMVFLGSIMAASTMMLVEGADYVDGELAQLRARAAGYSLETAGGTGPLELANAKAVTNRMAGGKINITATGVGDKGVKRTINNEQ